MHWNKIKWMKQGWNTAAMSTESQLWGAACEQLLVTRCDFTRRLEEDAAAPWRFFIVPVVLQAGASQQKDRGMEQAGAYGAGKAGSVGFDPVAFFTHPRTILRLMSWVSLLCNVRVDISGQACPHPDLFPIYVSRCVFQPAALELL